MNSSISLHRPAANPVSFYLSLLAKERPIYQQEQVKDVKRLDKVITIDSTATRHRLAENPSTDAETLLKLSQDTDPEVRLSAAEHLNLPYFALKRLVEDPCLDVRLGMAANPNLPISILEMLIKDENPYIQDRARRSIERLNSTRAKVMVMAAA
jgi:hypothetical protein